MTVSYERIRCQVYPLKESTSKKKKVKKRWKCRVCGYRLPCDLHFCPKCHSLQC